MPRRKNHPKKRSQHSSDASATPSESETSTPPSPALSSTVPVTEVPPLQESSMSETASEPATPGTTETPATPETPTDLSGAPIAEVPAQNSGLIRSVLRKIPIVGRFV